jgi:L-lactate dehydrogenase complex protein LldE
MAADVAPTRATLLITCVVDVVAPEVGEATVRLLRAAGCDVTCNLSQTCCGQPAWNAGFAEEAAAVARPTLDALEADLDAGADVVVVPAGSCATMVRLFWPELFEVAGDLVGAERARRVAGRTRELSEFLAERGDDLPALRLTRTTRVALHQSCHLHRELRVRRQPGDLLDRVEGCERVEWTDADRCCGFGGTFSVKLPEASVAMADDKLDDLAALGPDLVVGCDASCLLHLRTRAEARETPVQIEVRHLAEVLADALPAAVGWA